MDKKTILELLKLPKLLSQDDQRAIPWNVGEPIHSQVHQPAIDWFEKNVLGTNETEPDFRKLYDLPRPMRTAASCMALRVFQYATGADHPRNRAERESLTTFHTLIMAGVAMYVDLQRGDLVFDGELPEDGDRLGN